MNMAEKVFKTKERIFDLWAPYYDFPLTSVFYQAIHKRLLEYLDLPEDAYILDLGCGTGRLFRRLGKQFTSVRGVGLDLSGEMISQARERNLYPDRITYTQGNAESLPFEAETFTAAFNTISFLHYPNPQIVLREIHRVLMTGGRYYLADFTVRDDVKPPRFLFSSNKISFYSAKQRDNFAQEVGLKCLGHYYLLGPVLLTIFCKEG